MLDGRGVQDGTQAIRLVTTHAPVYVAHMQGGVEVDEDVRAFLSQAAALLHAPHAMVIVTSPRLPFVTPRHAGMYADYLTVNAELLRRNQRGLALVLRSALARGAFKAILSMASLPMPHAHFGTEGEALAWARAQMQAHTLSP